MTDLLSDVAFAWRNALRKPGTALLIVVTLALGIGASSAMFSLVWHVLLAPLPYEDGARLVKLEQNRLQPERLDFGWSVPTIRDFREQSTALADLFHYRQLPYTLVSEQEPHQVQAGIVSGNFFPALGIRARYGRGLSESDDLQGGEPVVVLSNDFWRNEFGADPAIIGAAVELLDIVYTVVGVLPEVPPFPHENDIWLPAATEPFFLHLGPSMRTNRRGENISHVFGKLREGSSLDDALAEAGTIAQRLKEGYPDSYAASYTIDQRKLREVLIAGSAPTFLLLFGLAFLILLISAANATSLMLARTLARGQELAVREAVGASPARIRRQLLNEGVFLALVAGLLGTFLAYAGLSLLEAFSMRYTALASEVEMNGFILAFSLLVSALAGVSCASASAFSDRDINKALKEGGGTSTLSSAGNRRRQGLLLMQYTLAFCVLTVSTLIVLSLFRLSEQGTGYELDGVLEVSMSLNLDLGDSRPQGYVLQMKEFARRFLAGARAMPEVESVAVRAGLPFLQDPYFSAYNPFDIESRQVNDPEDRPVFPINFISEDYLATMDIPLLMGRMFSETDDESATPVAIVNESFARQYFPAGDVIGQRLKLGIENEWRSIVGVVGDIRSRNLDQPDGPSVYYSFWQFPSEILNFYVRTAVQPEELASAFAMLVRDIDPDQSVASILPLREVKAHWLAPVQLRAGLIVLLGLLALVLTLTGVVGVVSYTVVQRIREVGIRVAVGANPVNIQNLFLAQGLVLYLIGLLLGLMFLAATAPLLQPLLFETSAFEPLAYLASLLCLSLTVLLAILVPAARAGRMSARSALQHE